MAENTSIEWCDATFNPWTGCTKVSPGCDGCYAESWSKRSGDKVGKWGPGAPCARRSRKARRECVMSEGKHTPVLLPSVAAERLVVMMYRSGWEIRYVDLDLTSEQPQAEIKVARDDGRWLWARVDAAGRCTVERFHRDRRLAMDLATKGRRPLTPMVEDVYLGRERYTGPRAMLRNLTAYLTDNALQPVLLTDMRAAWAAVMGAPLRLEFSAIASTTAPQQTGETQ